MSKEDLYNKYELKLQKMKKKESCLNRPKTKRLYASKKEYGMYAISMILMSSLLLCLPYILSAFTSMSVFFICTFKNFSMIIVFSKVVSHSKSVMYKNKNFQSFKNAIVTVLKMFASLELIFVLGFISCTLTLTLLNATPSLILAEQLFVILTAIVSIFSLVYLLSEYSISLSYRDYIKQTATIESEKKEKDFKKKKLISDKEKIKKEAIEEIRTGNDFMLFKIITEKSRLELLRNLVLEDAEAKILEDSGYENIYELEQDSLSTVSEEIENI